MEGTRLGAAMFKIRIQPHHKRERACWLPLFLAALILLPLVLMTSACTSNRMHRPPPENIRQEAGYTLAFIEFDDQGELWSPEQRERKNEAEAGGCAKQVFARSDAFKRPFRLEITRDGTVWVADAKASRIFGLDPDGSIRHTIASLD